MKNVCILIFLAFCSVANGQIINFPDPNFKNALVNSKCVDLDGDAVGDADADLNGDGEIDVSEALKVKTLVVVNKNIINFDGLHHFTSLVELNCEINKITTFKVENFPLLTKLDCSGCSSLSNLTLSNLPKLSNLDCSSSGLISLDLKDLPALATLNCSSNTSLKTLTLSNLPKLSTLVCGSSGLISLDLQDLPALATLNCYNNPLKTLTLSNLPKLSSLDCRSTGLISLDLKDLPALATLNCSSNTSLKTLTLSNLPLLSSLDCRSTGLISLDLKDLPALATLNCSFNTSLKTLTLSNLAKLSNLDCSSSGFISLDLQDLPALATLNCYNNPLKTLTLSNLPKLSSLDCRSTGLISLDLKDLPALATLNCSFNTSLKTLTLSNLPKLSNLNCSSSGFISLDLQDLQDLPALATLNCYNNPLKTLTLSNLPKLSTLGCGSSGLISLDLKDLPALATLNCSFNTSLKTLTLSNLPKLSNLDCRSSGFISLDLQDLPALATLNCSYNNPLKTLTLSNLPLLSSLDCRSTGLISLDLKDLPALATLNCSFNTSLKTLTLSNLAKLSNLDCSSSGLISLDLIFEKKLSTFNFSQNPTLQYICCSDSNYPLVESNLNLYNYTKVNVNTYCIFDPFGDFGIITGHVKYDVDNNGCDDNDKNIASIKFDISSDTKSGIYMVNNGNYKFPLFIGNNIIIPTIEQVGFTLTPNVININAKKGDTITQDFCITPKGIFRQTNITVIPLTPPARPGFEAKYKIVWENVGNQIESGTLNFTYNETLLDYISASQVADLVADGIIKWNFSNLLPFEKKREITVTLKVNRPTDTPAVNAGDKLYLTASILDNIFTLENTVVGSYDPNDKTCLQGDRVKPDMVGEYVDYLIRFENTGNYPAENIVVKDIIDTTTFDVSTLQITDASHEVYTRIEGNKVEFIFENINLPFDDANNDGYIAFKIKTLPTLVLGDSLKNLADIYFDYNFPIRTNEAQTTVALPVFTKDITTEVNIYPNPVKDILYLDTNESWTKAEIYDIAGRIMRSVSLYNQSIDVSVLESGTYFIRLKDGERVGLVKFVKM